MVKDKLTKYNHKAGFYRMRKCAIISACFLFGAVAIALIQLSKLNNHHQVKSRIIQMKIVKKYYQHINICVTAWLSVLIVSLTILLNILSSYKILLLIALSVLAFLLLLSNLISFRLSRFVSATGKAASNEVINN